VILLRPSSAPRVTLEPSDTLGAPKNVVEIGQSLREARERRGIALPEAESATMIRARYLEALEVERFELLPEGPYLRSFLREYAEYLGLDGDILVAEYVRRNPPPPPEPEAAPPRRMTVFADELVRRRSVLVAIGLIAAAVAVWQLGRSSHNAVQSAAANSPLVADASSSTPPAGTHAKQHAPARTTHRAAPPRQATLALTAVRGRCWFLARVQSSGGTVVAEQTLEQGQTARFALHRPLWIRLGAPWNVEAKIGSRTVTTSLPTLTGNVLVTSAGVQPA